MKLNFGLEACFAVSATSKVWGLRGFSLFCRWWIFLFGTWNKNLQSCAWQLEKRANFLLFGVPSSQVFCWWYLLHFVSSVLIIQRYKENKILEIHSSKILSSSFPRHRLTRHQYYLQLRKDMLEDRLYCNEETGLFLVALALQAEFGDYMPEVARTKNVQFMSLNTSFIFHLHLCVSLCVILVVW